MRNRYYSHGKLLLSGEYVVLDGALALALPTCKGQWLEIMPAARPGLEWNSLDAENSTWFQTHFSPEELFAPLPLNSIPDNVRDRLLFILKALQELQPGFLKQQKAVRVVTQLEFPREWGLGSSSTLLANLAQWAEVDPFALSELTLGGSGYDIACAGSNGPIFYQRSEKGEPAVEQASFHPSFQDSLMFIYLGHKQNSREGIAHYRAREVGKGKEQAIRDISEISRKLASARDLVTFREAMEASEAILSEVLGMPGVRDLYFSDFDGSVKSLGAWGGDFVLAAGGINPGAYFSQKGFPTQITYREMVL